MSRNDLCACGSGKRYKHCHGKVEFTGPSALHRQALAAHQAGALRRAEALYREALAADPQDVDSLHMLGVVHFERRQYREALERLWSAAERTGWNDAVARQNLGLVLAKLLAPEANARQEALVAAYQRRTRDLAGSAAAAGRVSVVLRTGQDIAALERALASVAAQTYRDIELVVVDEAAPGAVDAVLRKLAALLTVPTVVLRAEGRSPAQAANLGAARASGRHLAFLDPDDTFAPGRIAALVEAIARASPTWGFSQVEYPRAPDAAAGRAVRPSQFLAHDLPSFTMLAQNVAERPGNLFIDRDLFRACGGFHDSEHDSEHGGVRDRGWDFCVRAAQHEEPIVVGRPLYAHEGRAPVRIPPGTTPLADAAERGAAELFAEALAGNPAAANPFCPQMPANRMLLLRAELRAGHADRLPIDLLRTLAAQWRARPGDRPASGSHAPAVRGGKVALVVLGMYRSGTSAIARALNLSGAYLPERVVAARLGINPKGFWEAEAVTDLDARLLEHLGGEWNRVGFTLPEGGPLVDEFLLNARDVLASEYGDARTILIKDPRICVLAPLWNRALQQNGYRPAYVVLVRHPLETAGSLETQGDMPLATGLDLWLDYMQRVEAFAQTCGQRVVYVRYDELLLDWRAVLRSVARRLDVPLDLEGPAAEIDRFLEVGMRNHRAPDAGWAASIPGPRGEAVHTLYDRLLERCARDRSVEGT